MHLRTIQTLARAVSSDTVVLPTYRRAGFVTSIAARAASLEPGQASPAITIESDRFNVLVRQHGDITLAVKKEVA